jgi:hypothetical protein
MLSTFLLRIFRLKDFKFVYYIVFLKNINISNAKKYDIINIAIIYWQNFEWGFELCNYFWKCINKDLEQNKILIGIRNKLVIQIIIERDKNSFVLVFIKNYNWVHFS